MEADDPMKPNASAAGIASVSEGMAWRMRRLLEDPRHGVELWEPPDRVRRVALWDLPGDGADGLAGAVEWLERQERIGQVPILGVCGLMNAGKSTFVARFLSEAGRRRVLIGDTRATGTHRFTLWVPAAWEKDGKIRGQVEELLENAFGHAPERLAEEPGEAAGQILSERARLEKFPVPLLAFDEGLDGLGLGWLDCPDIQRVHDEGSLAASARERGMVLERGARICSGFFVVSTYRQLQARTLHEVLEHTGLLDHRLPLFCVLTKVTASYLALAGQDAREEMNRLGMVGRLHAILVHPQASGDGEDPLAIGYLDEWGEEVAPAALCEGLDAGDLQAGRIHRGAEVVRAAVEERMAGLAARAVAQQAKVERARRDLLGFLRKHFHHPQKGLVPLYSPEFALLLMESMRRTAPMVVRPTLRLGSWLKALREAAAGGFRNLQSLWQLLGRERARAAEVPLKQVGEEQFLRHLRGHGWLPDGEVDGDLRGIWRDLLEQAARGDWIHEESMRGELDESMRRIWQTVPKHRIALLALSFPAVLGSALALVLLVPPIDGGGIPLVLSASLTELLVSFGLGAAAAAAAGEKLNDLVVTHVARPQHSALYALLQDHFGLPRADGDWLRQALENRGMGLVESGVERLVRPRVAVFSEPLVISRPGDQGLSEALRDVIQPSTPR